MLWTRVSGSKGKCIIIIIINNNHLLIILVGPNTAVFGPTNFIGTTTSTARMRVYALDEDFYGGRTGSLEKFYLFIYFLLI